MRKRNLLALLAFLSTTGAVAQISIGVQTGANLSSSKSTSPSVGDLKGKFVVGFHAGVVADIALTPEVSAMPTLQYIQKGTKSSQQTTLLGTTTKVESTVSLNYLELPLNIVYNFELGETAKLFVGAGPMFSYALSGKVKTSVSSPLGTNTTTNDAKFGSNQTDNFKRFDFGVNGIVGVKLNNGFALSANYTKGLSNLSPADNSKYKGTSIGLSLNYFFNSDNEK
jgi:hypothetical protein